MPCQVAMTSGAVTSESGEVIEKLFYEPFGARQDVNGDPVAAPNKDVLFGFATHRHDDELGLIDMRGRVYDPMNRRFLTPDPIVSDPLSGQDYNRYSYVANNPINQNDPTGFCIGTECLGGGGIYGTGFGFGFGFGFGGTSGGGGFSGPSFACNGSICWSTQTQTTAPPTGSAPIQVSEELRPTSMPIGPTAPPSAGGSSVMGPPTPPGPTWGDRFRAAGRAAAAFGAGVALGIVPGGGLGAHAATSAGLISPGTWETRFARGIGEMVGGAVIGVIGIGGEGLGGGASGTGAGALVGVPVMVASASLVTGAAANIAAGWADVTGALMSKGEPEAGPQDVVPSLRPPQRAAGVNHPFEGIPKALHPEVFDIISDLQAARAGDAAAASRVLARRPHVLNGDLAGWTSLDISGSANALRFIFKETRSGFKWDVANTHAH